MNFIIKTVLFSLSGLAPPLMALSLNGAQVEKDKIVVYLLIGHSNMAGVDRNNTDNVPHPRAWNYEWYNGGVWVPAKEERGSLTGGLSGRGSGGAGMPFLKKMVDVYPGYHIGVITNASLSCTCRGVNTGMNSSGLPADENRYWPGAQLYNEIIAAALAVRDSVTLGGILCMLGSVEATRSSEEVCSAFSDNITEMVQYMRTDLGEPNLPFLMGEYEAGATGTFDPDLSWPGIIASQILLIPGKLPYSEVVSSQGIEMADDHHYTVAGRGVWAERAVQWIVDGEWIPPPGQTSISGRRICSGIPQTPFAALYLDLDLGSVTAVHGQSLYRLNGTAAPAILSAP